ncbi:fumarylacetoacetate hydrolase family protein [Pseudonocardia sp. CA-107938]|uniref:fumarylacetoacetate hydrolase family protein n=1 Tax=Pseudonocardia sp. CA-107938 TaxID=3240021 RepID=UPI003D949DB8
MNDIFAGTWVARAALADGPAVLLGRDGRTGRALVDGRGFPDLPELIEASGADWQHIDMGEDVDLDAGRLLSAVGRPGRILCAGLNYTAHAEEAGQPVGAHPVIFPKWHSALTGPYASIPLPPESEFVDWEAELAVVIGKNCRRVSREDTGSVVFGYTATNDVSMRDFQNHSSQHGPGKSWDAATPLGPVVAPLPVADPAQVDLLLEGLLNGEVVQSTRTSDMAHDVAALISYVSTWMTLEPGDVILTGTPGGVGLSFSPQRRLIEGDAFEVRLEGVGSLRNTFYVEEC